MAEGSRFLGNSLPKIDSIPNLRMLCKRPTSAANISTHVADAVLYRSSKPDRITLTDLDEFRKLGIKCIIDFRSPKEYLASDGHRILDAEYILYKVILPKDKYKPGERVQYDRVAVKQSQQTESTQGNGKVLSENSGGTPEKKHFLINFFSYKYVRALFKRLPWHLWCLGLLHLVWDMLLWNELKTFRKFMATKAVSVGGIFGQYVDLIEVSQPALCAALKLISDADNLPALINCAYGKDRTGIISALVLSCLGMPKDEVAKEYAMSTEGLNPIRHLMYRDIVEKHHLTEEFCTSDPTTMRDLLTYIEDRYTSVEQYLVSIGFTREEQQKLKINLEL
ncbi:unnamed protein product [Candidula unifasciata]|uniref:Tyrosine specific protein phosphatases domain-containing protein n=1 Tax=Candidula unifasciata TaxID=100452 RepID=A0A8S3YU24_9EUPU|nr:unnamed protein product [Candidula unifasciata]